MWPDDRDLTAELAAGGVAARHRLGAGTVPDPAFATALRSQLMTAHSAAVASLAPRPKRWTVADLFRGRRLAVTLAGALLIVAAGAAARTVLVRDEPAPVPPTPGISLPAVVVGELDGEVATATPSPTPTPTPSPSPTASPTPTPTASPTPSPTPTPVSTPKPTAKPAPKPTPIPTAAMALTASGCNGGVVLEWSKVVDERFNHYTTLRSTSASIPAAYPPQGGAVEVGGSYTMDAKATSAVDPSAAPGATLHYRTLAFDAEDRVIAVSPVRAAVAKLVAPLGPLGATPLGPDGTSFAWSAYGGTGVCYSYYKLVASESDPTPSYLEGSETWAAIADQEATSVTVEGIPSGTTWHVRLQAIRASSLGKIVVAQTDVLTWTAP